MRSPQKLGFIAKTVTDLGKAVFVAGLVSAFFEQFPLAWRIVISVLSVVFIVAGVILYPEQGGHE